MPTGEIRRLNTEQGIGYIRETGEENDISFHAVALIDGTFDRLRQGQKVEFELQAFAHAPHKSRAIKVRLARVS